MNFLQLNLRKMIKQDFVLYKVNNLQEARIFLLSTNSKIILTNNKGVIYYYGMRVLDYIFKTLLQEFPEKIHKIFINTYDNYHVLVTAKKMGYDHFVN